MAYYEANYVQTIGWPPFRAPRRAAMQGLGATQSEVDAWAAQQAQCLKYATDLATFERRQAAYATYAEYVQRKASYDAALARWTQQTTAYAAYQKAQAAYLSAKKQWDAYDAAIKAWVVRDDALKAEARRLTGVSSPWPYCLPSAADRTRAQTLCKNSIQGLGANYAPSYGHLTTLPDQKYWSISPCAVASLPLCGTRPAAPSVPRPSGPPLPVSPPGPKPTAPAPVTNPGSPGVAPTAVMCPTGPQPTLDVPVVSTPIPVTPVVVVPSGPVPSGPVTPVMVSSGPDRTANDPMRLDPGPGPVVPQPVPKKPPAQMAGGGGLSTGAMLFIVLAAGAGYYAYTRMKKR